jgi:segregation and condensation protein A
VRINEVDIYDIPVVEIARQYDQHLEMMRHLDLDIAGEFLVMAATLAYIKSRMLLPRPVGEDGEEEDPRAELAQQLLERQRFLLAAEELSARSDLQESIWTRGEEKRLDVEGEFFLEVSLHDLVRSFQGLMESIGIGAGMEIEPEGISVHERMGQIIDLLEGAELVEFRQLFPQTAPKRDLIVTFLAVLELLRLQMIGAWQRRSFGEIRLSRAVARPGAPRVDEGSTP